MSMFKFHDSNFLNGFNRPDVVATETMSNGYQFKIVDNNAVAHETASDVQSGDGYVMMNIIDKPEVLNTDDFCVKAGEYVRAFRLKDFVGLKVDISADLVSDAYSTVSAGDYLVGRSEADTSGTMLWKKIADPSSYSIYLEVIEKTPFGSFTVDLDGGVVPGGYLCEIKAN